MNLPKSEIQYSELYIFIKPSVIHNVVFALKYDEGCSRSEFCFQFHRQNAVCHRQYQSNTYQSPTPKYCHNISLNHHLNPPINQDAKPEVALFVAMETQNKRENRFPFPRNAGNWSRLRRIFLPLSKLSSEGGGGGENARRRRESWFDVGNEDFHQSEREEPTLCHGRGREAEDVSSFLRRPEVIQCACRSARNVMEATETRLWLRNTNWRHKWRAKRGCYPRRNRNDPFWR